jgi:glycosyltransferase involved in cell wall biosynthesis
VTPPSIPPVPLLVVLKGYPRVSETFIAHELAALERRGVRLAIASLRHPYDAITQPIHAEIRAPVIYLPEYLVEAPVTVAVGHLIALGRAPRRYLEALGLWLRDLWRDPTVNRVRRFGQAGVLAGALPAEVRHLHAQFAHTPASVARYAARMTGRSFSFSAHAKDIWTLPDWELAEKLLAARFAVACTAEGARRLTALAPDLSPPVALVYHGLDRALFAPPPAVGSGRDGTDPGDPVRLLAVARLQPKKGFPVLLDAVARVRRHVRLTVVGYGPMEAELRGRAQGLGLGARIVWAGPLDQPAVRAAYRESDLFVLAPTVAPDGDRDGLPNVVVEALSQGLPVVATRTAAIAEIVDEGVHGRLVPGGDPDALAATIDELAGDPERRRRFGQAAIARVATGWDLESGIDRILALLESALGSPPAGARRDAAAGSPSLAGRS